MFKLQSKQGWNDIAVRCVYAHSHKKRSKHLVIIFSQIYNTNSFKNLKEKLFDINVMQCLDSSNIRDMNGIYFLNVNVTWWDVVFPGGFPLAPLCPPVLEPDLHPGLRECQLECQLLPREHVGVRRPLERPLKLLQLVGREGGPGTSMQLLRVTGL